MDWIEIEGETKEEVESKALEALKMEDINALEIEEVKVIRKFLGMGGKTIKIRARVKADEAETAEEPGQTDAPDDGGAAAPMAVTGLVEQAQPATEPAEPATEPAEPATEQAQPATEPEAKQVEPATEQAQPA
ncbi:hypothetical protein MNBD_NITROSPINAE02-200, partial [hydrothermal vent metagenome]